MAEPGGGIMTLPQGQVTVHVFDSERGVSKDFNCEASTLLNSMKYFARFLAQNHAVKGTNVAISVHCDVDVFDKLLSYSQARARGKAFMLCDADALPMLIAGNFLQMEELVGLCLQYISSRLTPVALLASDLTMLPAGLFIRLAQVTSEGALEAVHTTAASGETSAGEASDSEGGAANKTQLTPQQIQHLQQLINRLYKHKLELMLKELRTTVVRCVHCGAMYSLADKHKIICTARTSQPNTRTSGAPAAPPTHEPDPGWRLQDHLATLRGMAAASGAKPDASPASPAVASWRDIYWDVWGVVHVLYCHHCLQYFPAQELALCSYHPEPPIFTVGRTTGRYPCCGGHASRAGTMPLFSVGCCAREHQVLPASMGAPATSALAAGRAGAGSNLPERMTADWATLQAFRHLIVPEPAAWGMMDLGSQEGEEEGDEQEEEEEEGEEGEEEAGPGPMSAATQRQGQQGHTHRGGRHGAGTQRSGGRGSSAGQFSMYMQPLGKPQSARSPKQPAAQGSHNGGGLGGGETRARPSPPHGSSMARRQLSGSLSGSGRFEGLEDGSRGAAEPGGAVLEAASVVAHRGQATNTQQVGQGPASVPRLSVASGASAAVQQAGGLVGLAPRRDGASDGAGGAAGMSPRYMQGGQQAHLAQPVKVVPLSALGSVAAAGGGYSPSQGFGGPGAQVSRKLRLELLHEDDMNRMDALIQHLAACRPSRVKAGLQAATAAGSAQQHSGQPPRAPSVGRQHSHSLHDSRKSGPMGSGQQGGASPGVGGPQGPARSSSATRGGLRIIPANAPGHGGGGGGPARPVSAPRMRPGTAQSDGRGGPSAAQLRRLPSANIRPPLYI